jgi:hypothetical protein
MSAGQTIGEPEPFSALGLTWYLSPISAGVRATYSDYCKLKALSDLRSLKDAMSPDEYREDRALLYARISAGEYTWGTPLNPEGLGEAVQVILNSDEGKLRLLQILLLDRHGELPGPRLLEILADAPEEVARALRVAMRLPRVEKAREPKAAESGPFVHASLNQETPPHKSGWRDDDGA